MRHSLAPNRASQAGSYSNSSATTLAKLLEKKKEYEAVSALERSSSLYLERIEALGDECDIMANAAEVHGQVLAQWPKMFNVLGQFLASREQSEAENDLPTPLKTVAEGERLVRIPLEELQQGNAEKQ
ncbi:hypothetical protein HYPSUDRAFT_130784 [Hypholoma sublateritium FD-334 SS-4]|uniref:DASH complex subunit DAD2 n=1 Tax=Hypholoma sublateritium (strain FD-334 SS-4) TaxID=945553 RepID=A0A0D2LJB5_HYPSF|nr:hypothetical protein HYPSUDRAFT_130784 [Hypholoma sublateritium FD-334 SS-4]